MYVLSSCHRFMQSLLILLGKCTRDLLLIVDTSNSFDPGRISKNIHFDLHIKLFLQMLISVPRLNVGRDGTQVAMINFSDRRRTRILLNFGDTVEKDELEDYIGNLKRKDLAGGMTRTDLALQIANEKVRKNNKLFNQFNCHVSS